MNQSSNKRHNRARIAWLLFGAAGCASLFTGACSDPFESCEERRACEPGGAAGTAGSAGKSAAGDGGVPGSTSAGAGGASYGTGGEPMQNEAGERSVGGSLSGGSPSGGSPGDAGAGGTPVIEQGGAAGASQGGTTAQGGTVGQGGVAAYGGPCKPKEAKLCSAVFPGIAKCGGKRIECPSTGYWPSATEACVPVAETNTKAFCSSSDDNDCNGVPDHEDATCTGCTLGQTMPCYLGDSECISGYSECVQDGSVTRFDACHALPTSGATYPMNRVWCSDESILGAPCITSLGRPGTLLSKCDATPNTCGYLYCLSN